MTCIIAGTKVLEESVHVYEDIRGKAGIWKG